MVTSASLWGAETFQGEMTSELSLEGSSGIRQRGMKVAFQTKETTLYAKSHRQRKAEHIKKNIQNIYWKENTING